MNKLIHIQFLSDVCLQCFLPSDHWSIRQVDSHQCIALRESLHYVLYLIYCLEHTGEVKMKHTHVTSDELLQLLKICVFVD